jgi:hypothetical protein
VGGVAGYELIQLIFCFRKVKWFLGLLLRGQKEGMTPVSSACMVKIISGKITYLPIKL